ncbi:CBS domain protein [Gracilibacillus boraciitolerans JCM 21714]|uniref:CBS domain protein n=1 Tax=Gracilibacillus boraciitolerans JCM 21714 TaxID=1298598 RepID=W4VFE2_9BACI|nr:CBS domain-containing protein [Gracilibacillus boraciitolerans]GAE91469.1 CBS domain protein [Gracilibacillus boraciitolerans JCM 21714]
MAYELSTRFEAAFNQIHEKLCDYAQEDNNYASFTEVLTKAKFKHQGIDQYYDLLKQCSKLRNALIHRKVKEDFYIAEPHEEIVKELETLAKLLAEPPSAVSIASQPVEFFYLDTPVIKVMDCIKEKGYSQYPVYHKQKFIGLLTDGDIANWFATNLDTSSLSSEATIGGDIFKIEKKDDTIITAVKSSVVDIESLFRKYVEKNQKLEAIIITETGSEAELPVGIISSWDLIRLKNYSFPLLRHT